MAWIWAKLGWGRSRLGSQARFRRWSAAPLTTRTAQGASRRLRLLQKRLWRSRLKPAMPARVRAAHGS